VREDLPGTSASSAVRQRRIIKVSVPRAASSYRPHPTATASSAGSSATNTINDTITAITDAAKRAASFGSVSSLLQAATGMHSATLVKLPTAALTVLTGTGGGGGTRQGDESSVAAALAGLGGLADLATAGVCRCGLYRQRQPRLCSRICCR